MAQLEMPSVFVAHERAGDNHSVVRVPLAPASSSSNAGNAKEAASSAQSARAVRAGAWHERFSVNEHAPPLARDTNRPCPANDFNGAGLLYRASFQALTDCAH